MTSFRQWNKQDIVDSLHPFSFEQVTPLGPKEREYCYFYDIDFFRTLPGVRQQMGYFDCLGFRIVMQAFQPEKPRGTVLVLHGYFDHVGLYRHLIRFLLENNYAVVSYDLPGHGLSSGDAAAIKSFAHYQSVLNTCLNRMKGQITLPLHAIGQSTGAAVLTDYYLSLRHTRETGVFSRVIMLAPLVRPVGWKSALVTHMLLKPFFSTWRRALRKNSSDNRFIRFLKNIDPLQSKTLSVDWVTSLKRWVPRVESAPPVDMDITIIQGDSDGTVDWRHNLVVLHDKFHQTHVHYLPGAEHHLVNEGAEIRAKMLRIIQQVLQQHDNN